MMLMLITAFWCPTCSHIFLMPAVMSEGNDDGSTFWATVDTWWYNMAASSQEDLLFKC